MLSRTKRRTILAAALAATTVLASNVILVSATAAEPEPVQRIGRWLGAGWGDGYHSCADSGFRPGANLPPRSYHKQFSQRSSFSGHVGRGNIATSGSYYDRFDASCQNCAPAPRAAWQGQGAQHTRIAVPAPCDAGVCDAAPVPPTPAPVCDSASCDQGGCDAMVISEDFRGQTPGVQQPRPNTQPGPVIPTPSEDKTSPSPASPSDASANVDASLPSYVREALVSKQPSSPDALPTRPTFQPKPPTKTVATPKAISFPPAAPIKSPATVPTNIPMELPAIDVTLPAITRPGQVSTDGAPAPQRVEVQPAPIQQSAIKIEVPGGVSAIRVNQFASTSLPQTKTQATTAGTRTSRLPVKKADRPRPIRPIEVAKPRPIRPIESPRS